MALRVPRGPYAYNTIIRPETECRSTATAAAATSAAPSSPSHKQELSFSMALTFIIFISALLIYIHCPVKMTRKNYHDHQHVFYLNSLVLSEIQALPAQLTGKCHVSMVVGNLADQTVYQEDSILSIFLHNELLWVIRTGGFFLEGQRTTMFNVTMNAATNICVPSSVPTALLEARKLVQPLYFKIKYGGTVRKVSGKDRLPLYVCGWIPMLFVDESTLKGGPIMPSSCYIEDK